MAKTRHPRGGNDGCQRMHEQMAALRLPVALTRKKHYDEQLAEAKAAGNDRAVAAFRQFAASAAREVKDLQLLCHFGAVRRQRAAQSSHGIKRVVRSRIFVGPRRDCGAERRPDGRRTVRTVARSRAGPSDDPAESEPAARPAHTQLAAR